MKQSNRERVVIVTGASGGIGEATARFFAQNGWAVVLAARSEEKVQDIVREIEASGGLALAVKTDVTDYLAVEALVEKTLERFDRIDAVVNNAGRGSFGTVASLDLEELENLFRLNVFAPVAVMRAVVPAMRQRGGGVIVNVSSQVENIATPFLGSYAASKISLSYLSDAARIELDHAGIAVTNVLPGLTDTGFGGNTDRIGSTDDFILKDGFSAGPGGGVTPEKVAETIWEAVHKKPRQMSVSTGDRIGGAFARRMPGTVNRLLRWGVTRYVPREGYTPPTPRKDLGRIVLGVGATVTAAAVLRALRSGRQV